MVRKAGGKPLLSEQDLVRIEKSHPNGLTSAQIIQIFQSHSIKLSEATFRKYVQLGLLPRSRRVGAKGKHRGSKGIYPSATVRRINSIKRLMSQSFTIEEIQQSFAAFKQEIDSIESALSDLLRGFEREIEKPHFDLSEKRHLSKEVVDARRVASELVKQISAIEQEITKPKRNMQLANDGMFTETM